MSSSVLDLTSHVLATAFLIYRIAGTSFEPFVAGPLEAVMREHQLRVCGSIDAATANLDETWREAKGAEKEQLKNGFHEVLATLARWRDEGALPTSEYCQEWAARNPNPLTQRFRFELYRLDEVDEPIRRVNWRYRIVAENEI